MENLNLKRENLSNIDEESQSEFGETAQIETSSLTGGLGLSIDEDYLKQIQERDALRCFFNLKRKSAIALAFDNAKNTTFLILRLVGHIVK